MVVSVPAAIWFGYRIDKLIDDQDAYLASQRDALERIEESIIGPHERTPDDSLTKAIQDQKLILESQNEKMEEQAMLINSLIGVSESQLELTEKVAGVQRERGKRISTTEKNAAEAKKRILALERRMNAVESAHEVMRAEKGARKRVEPPAIRRPGK